MQPIAKNDLCIGHIISLLQYSFPEESDLFFMILHRIKMSETFTYPIFMHHIVHIEFLEEFSNFMVDNTNTVTLDIGKEHMPLKNRIYWSFFVLQLYSATLVEVCFLVGTQIVRSLMPKSLLNKTFVNKVKPVFGIHGKNQTPKRL